jgi:hypothetical protein
MLAQNLQISGKLIVGPLQGINTLGDLVNRVLLFLMPLSGVILLLVLIWGGYDFLTSGGDAAKVKNAQAKITTGLIGFFILIFAYFITRVIAYIFGLETGIF